MSNPTPELIMSNPTPELIELYIRFAKLQKQIVKIEAELDNVRELIRQKS